MTSPDPGPAGRGLGNRARRFWRVAGDRLRRVLRTNRDRGPAPESAAPNQEHDAPSQEPGAPSHLRDQTDTTVIGPSNAGTWRSDALTAVGLNLDERLAAVDPRGSHGINQLGSEEFAELVELARREAVEIEAARESAQPDDAVSLEGLDHARGSSSHLNSDRAPSPVDEAARREAFVRRWEATRDRVQREREAAHHAPAPAPSPAPDSVDASVARFEAIVRRRRERQGEREGVNATRRSSQEQEQEPGGPDFGL
jgi:hypothetical protein